MSEFPLGYEQIAPITWAYLSSLLMVGLFFKFSRFWSVRNLDLVFLTLLTPGLLMVHYGTEHRQAAQAELSQELDASGDDAQTDDSTSETPTSDNSSATGDESDPEKIDVESARQTEEGDSTLVTTEDAQESINAEAAGSSIELTQSDPSKTARIDLTVNESESETGSDGSTENEAGSSTLLDAGLSEELVSTLSLIEARNLERRGYLWLFGAALLFLVRMLIDPMMVRRPLLEPNLTAGGLTFIGCAMLVFLFANIAVSKPSEDDLYGPASAENLVERRVDHSEADQQSKHGPGYALLHVLPSIPTFVESEKPSSEAGVNSQHVSIAKAMAIFSQLALAVGIALIGYRHFGNYQQGVGVATLYLLLPYTAQMTGHVTHVLPAALLVWALVCYRRPLASGIFVGLAMGVCYYPMFLLPLWMSFYWRRGLARFASGFASMIVVLGISLAFVSADFAHYVENLRSMFGIWLPQTEGLQGDLGTRLGFDLSAADSRRFHCD